MYVTGQSCSLLWKNNGRAYVDSHTWFSCVQERLQTPLLHVTPLITGHHPWFLFVLLAAMHSWIDQCRCSCAVTLMALTLARCVLSILDNCKLWKRVHAFCEAWSTLRSCSWTKVGSVWLARPPSISHTWTSAFFWRNVTEATKVHKRWWKTGEMTHDWFVLC